LERLKEFGTFAAGAAGTEIQGYEKGFFMGACLFDHVTTDMKIYKEEIFGPVLSIVRAPDYNSAIEMVNEHEFGNSVSIYTQNGNTARHFGSEIQARTSGASPCPQPLQAL